MKRWLECVCWGGLIVLLTWTAIALVDTYDKAPDQSERPYAASGQIHTAR